jgi:hypothetical protein
VTAPVGPKSRETQKVREIVKYLEGLRSGATVWYGSATGAWWAMVPLRSGMRLVEAVNPRELREAIVNPGAWPWPRQ